MKLHEQGKYKNKSTSPVVKMNIYMFIHKIKCSERKQIVFEMALLWHIIRNTSVFRCTKPDLDALNRIYGEKNTGEIR